MTATSSSSAAPPAGTATGTTTPNGPLTATAAGSYQRLRAHLDYLKLPTAAEHLPAVLDAARTQDLSVTAALERLLELEVHATEDRRRTGRLRFASLPAPWTLEDLDFDASPTLDRALITDLASLRFLEQACNVLLVGPPGVGKTHIAVGLARKAAEAGYRVYFTTAADLAARCHRAALEGRWATTMRFYAGPTLLVIDELGYLPLPADAAAALFQVISMRHLKTSIVLTTNRQISSWGTVFGDDMLAAAMLDRLLDRSVVMHLDGDSYRLRHHQARAAQLRPHRSGSPSGAGR